MTQKTPTAIDDADREELEDLADLAEVELDAYATIYGRDGEAAYAKRLGYRVRL